ncbi:MAG: hypothetical protein EPO21_17215 [Chloroflexota bacterium]|nr:MAG: hypothetical protein EPO21_17215 [Chloroflexota bacterium]
MVVQAIRQRRSIRAFKPNAVPRKILSEIVETAQRAPSWANTQPWELAIVSGDKLEEIRQACVDRFKSARRPETDFPSPLAFPRGFLEPYGARAAAKDLFAIKGIARDDRERRAWWRLEGVRLYGAPAAIFIYVDRSMYAQDGQLNVYPFFDCGMLAQNIMLLASQRELGTVPQIQGVLFPDVLREKLGLPDSKLMLISIAIGYPDETDPINQYRSEREPLEVAASWYGF